MSFEGGQRGRQEAVNHHGAGETQRGGQQSSLRFKPAAATSQ